ncbi:hypothetical protein AUEXF2481DRAFT_40421 [Aureobasidium subglaciale EXF-2481]|uniref:Uncharacterized protein n=1 Tax=Aureobasidium subglaciale (strain EXF-2481) TaxID=1043005 RepID=A0A074YM40_AURSE|nr:uncharacterized protein AUEXF2481DRAFT_40421 [Aureobasidium subglaciale EXF-2481]KEQ95157.1 hypothetical protein AUEXF2481DRAFT_40421 [Aureobasidium subglaciale EXF-2481]
MRDKVSSSGDCPKPQDTRDTVKFSTSDDPNIPAPGEPLCSSKSYNDRETLC